MRSYRVGKELRMYRLKLKLTQQALAKKLGYTPQFITNWERGISNPPIKAIPKLCRTLKIKKERMISFYVNEVLDQMKKNT